MRRPYDVIAEAIQHQDAASCPCCDAIYKAYRKARRLWADEDRARARLVAALETLRDDPPLSAADVSTVAREALEPQP